MTNTPSGSKDPTLAKESVKKKRPVVAIEEVEDEHHETLRFRKINHTLDDNGPIIEEITSSTEDNATNSIKKPKDEEHSSTLGHYDPKKPTRATSPTDDEVRKPTIKDAYKRPKTRRKSPPLEEHSFPTIHSSKGPKRDRFGKKDPFGFNEVFLKTIDERQAAIRAEDEEEKHIEKICESLYTEYKDIMEGTPSKQPPFH